MTAEMDAVTWPCGTISRAWFDEARRFRFMLERDFREGEGAVAFVLLNPSVADAHTDDATIRRCSGFTKRWGKKRLIVVNLFPLRATNPKELLSAALDDYRRENDSFILRAVADSSLVIAGWGTRGALRNRGSVVRALIEALSNLHHLGLTKDGHPHHPLYLRADTQPQLWTRAWSPNE